MGPRKSFVFFAFQMLRLSPLAAQQLHCFSKAHCHSGKILGQLSHLGKKVLGQKSHLDKKVLGQKSHLGKKYLGNCRLGQLCLGQKSAWTMVPRAKIAAPKFYVIQTTKYTVISSQKVHFITFLPVPPIKKLLLQKLSI